MSGHSDNRYQALRTKAIESLLVEKKLLSERMVDTVVETYEQDIGPLRGARVVARAWVDEDFERRLLADATAAMQELGIGGFRAERVIAVKNTESVHNLVVCTLCSCYPWAVLGIPPSWYKSPEYRAKAVRDPRGVLREFGVELPEATRIRVWDASANARYLVIPMRPPGTAAMSEQELARLVGRDSMIGVGLAAAPGQAVTTED
jgi:nitrile hydratase